MSKLGKLYMHTALHQLMNFYKQQNNGTDKSCKKYSKISYYKDMNISEAVSIKI